MLDKPITNNKNQTKEIQPIWFVIPKLNFEIKPDLDSTVLQWAISKEASGSTAGCVRSQQAVCRGKQPDHRPGASPRSHWLGRQVSIATYLLMGRDFLILLFSICLNRILFEHFCHRTIQNLFLSVYPFLFMSIFLLEHYVKMDFEWLNLLKTITVI